MDTTKAFYGIGARYFIREILKSEPVMARLPDETKVFRYGTGTTRTLSTLIKLHADIIARQTHELRKCEQNVSILIRHRRLCRRTDENRKVFFLCVILARKILRF